MFFKSKFVSLQNFSWCLEFIANRDIFKLLSMRLFNWFKLWLAGVVMFGPMGNPYGKNMTKEESKIIWKGASRQMKMMFRLARHFPSYLPGYLRKGPLTKIVKFLRSVKKTVNPKVGHIVFDSRNVAFFAENGLWRTMHVAFSFCSVNRSYPFNSMRLFIRSWSPMIFHWLFCRHYQ